MGDVDTVVIAISRQIACGGALIAESTARRLGYRYVDRDVLYEAARDLDVEVDELSGMEEKSSGFFENLLRSFSYGPPEATYVVPSRRRVYDRDLFDAEAAIIKRLAENQDAVILGRGGGLVLQDHPGLVKVFLHAPERARIMRLMRNGKCMDSEKARQAVKESDGNREKFLRSMTGVDWTDTRNYHLSIDTSLTGIQGAEDLIIRLVNEKRRNLGKRHIGERNADGNC